MKLRQTLITGSIILAAGAYKTFKDYNNEDNLLKKKTLARDIIALGVASSTVFAVDCAVSKRFKSYHLQNVAQNLSKKIIDSGFFKYISQKFPKLNLKPIKMETLSDILSSCIKDVSLSAAAAVSGLSAGILTDEFMNKKEASEKIMDEKYTVSERYKRFTGSVDRLSNNRIVNTAMNDNTRELILNTTKVFEKTGFIFNPFDKTGAILSGLEISKERNLKRVLEQTSTGIVAGAIIPAFMVSIGNTLTKKQSLKIKIPVLAALLYLGDFLGSKASKYLSREVKVSKEKIDAEKII